MKDLYYTTRGGNYAKNDYTDYHIFGHNLTDTENYWIATGLLKIIIISSGLYIFFKKIYPYKKDADSGVKEMITYTITDKKHFPLTDQYFVSFDNPDYMHYEVDASLYNSLEPGDSIAIYRGVYSQHVFEKDGRFTLM